MDAERVTDSLGRTWTLGAAVGRGSWGQSRLARDGDGAREVVVKLPYGPAEVGAAAEACATIAREQIAHAQEPSGDDARIGVPRVEATVTTLDGRTGYLLPLYPTLEKRIEAGMPLTDALRVVIWISEALAAGRLHGNLKPSNVLFGERGELLLADPCTPTWLARPTAPREAAGQGRGFLPPEAGRAAPSPTNDTWSLCQILWAAIDSRHEPASGGVDKVAVAAAKDRAHAAFATEGSNPRFRGRIADRLGALLSRGLSAERSPSPPYRFESTRELSERLAEVGALVRPRVIDVGHLLPPSSAKDAVFHGDAAVSFSVTVGSTVGVTDPDDLVCGLVVADLDRTDDHGRPVRIAMEDAHVEVVTHPSGRLRFQFGLPGVGPGRYRLRVAFAVKDGGDEPLVATGDFEVRPAPGYVPPAPTPTGPKPLLFPRSPSSLPPRDEPLTDPGEDDVDDAPTPALPFATPAALPRVRESSRPDPAPLRAALEPEATPISALSRFPRPVPPPDEEDDEENEPPTVQVRRLPLVIPSSADNPPSPTFRSFDALEPAPRDAGEGLDTEELLKDTEEHPISDTLGIPTPKLTPLANTRLPPTGPPASQRAGQVVELRPSQLPTVPPVAELPRSVPGAAPEIAPPALFQDRPSDPGLDLPAPDTARDPASSDPASSGAGEDLPGYGAGGSALPGPVAAAFEVLRRDRYLSVGVAVASCLVLVLVLTMALKAC